MHIYTVGSHTVHQWQATLLFRSSLTFLGAAVVAAAFEDYEISLPVAIACALSCYYWNSPSLSRRRVDLIGAICAMVHVVLGAFWIIDTTYACLAWAFFIFGVSCFQLSWKISTNKNATHWAYYHAFAHTFCALAVCLVCSARDAENVKIVYSFPPRNTAGEFGLLALAVVAGVLSVLIQLVWDSRTSS
ncbi:hypothetical protein AAMO2058_000848300 [Amorphochlora amoebiformis]